MQMLFIRIRIPFDDQAFTMMLGNSYIDLHRHLFALALILSYVSEVDKIFSFGGHCMGYVSIFFDLIGLLI